MLDWLLIGGGPQGVHGALRVSLASPASRIAILDPHEAPLHDWDAVTRGVGMSHLRSPVVHHIGRDPMELADFVRAWDPLRRKVSLKGRYRRPSLDLFGAHARHVFDRADLGSAWHRGEALAIERLEHGWRVETDRGGIEARRVVLAIGTSRRLHWPEWAPRGSSHVSHVLDPARTEVDHGPVLVVGGGLSAVQSAVTLSGRDVDVTLLSRHPARVHRFDTDPGWLGPKRMRGFRMEPSPDRRRAMIREARHLGSVTSETLHALRASVSEDGLRWWQGEVRGATVERGGVEISVERSGDDPRREDVAERVRVRHLLLATGYADDASSPPWIRSVGERLGLPLAQCGTPVPDSALQWAPGLHLMGPLAELELGPTSRNIAGSRRAGDILRVIAERIRPAAVSARSA